MTPSIRLLALRALFATTPLLSACAFGVGELSPAPHIFVEGRMATKLALNVANDVRDSFVISEDAGGGVVYDTTFSDWRKTLQNGFRTGFARSFTLADDARDADLTVAITEATLTFTFDKAKAGRSAAQLRYRAELRDRSGAVSGSTDNVVSAVTTESRIEARGPSARDAVATMYEQIANTFFVHTLQRAP